MKKAVVVEDDEEWSSIFSELLARLGFSVSPTSRLSAGLAAVRNNMEDLEVVVLDASLARAADCLEEVEILLSELKSIGFNGLVIVASGYWTRPELMDRLAEWSDFIGAYVDKATYDEVEITRQIVSRDEAEFARQTRISQYYTLMLDHFLESELPDRTGLTFEMLVSDLLEAFGGYEVVARRHRTITGELDIICKTAGGSVGTSGEMQSDLVVECKDWASTVDSAVVDRLGAEMDRAGVSVGAVVSRHGLSGRSRRTDAWAARHYWFHRRGILILDIEIEDLRKVANLLVQFGELIENQVRNLRFSVKS